MKIDELTQNDKNMDFKILNIKKEVQDEIMEYWKFDNVGQAFEAGMLILQTFTSAAKQGCKVAYFEKEEDGERGYFAFNYIGLVEYLKDPNRPEGSTHAVQVQPYDKDKASGTNNSAGPNPQ